MLSQTDYNIVWVFYLLSATGLFLVCCLMLKALPWRPLRFFLAGLLLGLLYFPWMSYDDQAYWAPAFIIALMERFFDKDPNWTRAAIPLVIAMTAVSSLALFYALIRRPATD